jgi:DNA mismatch repair protein MutS2
VAELRDELEAARKALERGHLTVPGIDAVLERADQRLASAPATRRPKPAVPASATSTEAPRPWEVGDQARSISGGWTGRIAEMDKAKRRATLEAGSLRVSVDLADLERAAGGSAAAQNAAGGGLAGTNVEQIRQQRARSVPMSLDLRGARVEEALSALERYLEDASLAGLPKVSVIHGMGTGALRDAVRNDAGAHPLVRTVRAGERGEGGDGVTVVELA